MKMSSLRQQGHRLDDESLLQISVEKGGTSVLTDAYLVRGGLAPDDADFAFGYGVLLQLMDDLQDFPQDLKHDHATLVTRQAALGSVESVVRRLRSFVIGIDTEHARARTNFFARAFRSSTPRWCQWDLTA